MRTGSLVRLLVEPNPRSAAPSPEKVMALHLRYLYNLENVELPWRGAHLCPPGRAPCML